MKIKPFKLERYYTLYEHSAKYSLCNSDCEAMSIKELLDLEEGAEEKFLEQRLGYTETQGSSELRQDISTLYKVISAEQLIVCTGAQEPIFLFSHALLNAGDEVIVQTPCYQSLHSIPESIGCTVKNWNVHYEGSTPTFKVEELEHLVNDHTKIIYLNAPHNPTGFIFTNEEQQAIIEIARKYNIVIFCDEVYKGLEHHPEIVIPAFADAYELGVSIGVMSKSLGLPGLRIGWLATQEKSILEKIAILKEYTTICNAGPSEFLAGVALRNKEHLFSRNLTIVKKNLALYEPFFNTYRHLFSWFKPQAGPVTFVKMHFDNDDTSFAEQVLSKQQLLLLLGSIYDFPDFFRIGFGRMGIPKALEQFEQYVTAYLVEA